jgi:hypothetical protein
MSTSRSSVRSHPVAAGRSTHEAKLPPAPTPLAGPTPSTECVVLGIGARLATLPAGRREAAFLFFDPMADRSGAE